MDEPDEEMVELATRVFGLARQGATDTLAAYLDAGIPADLCNQTGDSLVMLAAYHGHAGTVRALLARGADPNRPNDRGQRPLAGAVFKSEVDVIRALLAGGADPEAGQPSAVETAAMFGRQDLIDLMRPPADPPPAFARDPATAVYYDQRASEYDEWYEDEGQYAARHRPGWREEVQALVEVIRGLPNDSDNAEARTLDVACGTGYLTRHLRGRVVGIDQSRRMVAVARGRLPTGAVAAGDALSLPFPDQAWDRLLTAHFYGHLAPAERTAFLAEAHRVARQLVVVDSAWRPDVEAEQWQSRVLNDGSRHRVYKRYLRPDQLAAEIGGRVLWSGRWFVAAVAGP